MGSEHQRAGRRDAREALESINVARRQRAMIAPPQWVHWTLGMFMVVDGLAQLLAGGERLAVEVLVLVAIFVLSFAVQRRSGVVTRLTRPPRRPLAVWVAFSALVVGAVLLTNVSARVGLGRPVGFFALGLFIVTAGPGLQRVWGRFG